jgi:hypothetical protein
MNTIFNVKEVTKLSHLCETLNHKLTKKFGKIKIISRLDFTIEGSEVFFKLKITVKYSDSSQPTRSTSIASSSLSHIISEFNTYIDLYELDYSSK